MTISGTIEAAIYRVLKTYFDQEFSNVVVVPFSAASDQVDIPETLPRVIQVAAEPFIPVICGAKMGASTVRLIARVNADEPDGELDILLEAAQSQMTVDILGPASDYPITICGIDDRQPGTIEVDEEKQQKQKGKPYIVHVATVTTTTTP
jgi:hypothetical protein